ncbi:MAG: ATP-binding cassette domain-containing protein [Actinobacteria bacterium]|nr:ATP-binding cassette domain-containing protein [Actinomycetota bacterium]
MQPIVEMRGITKRFPGVVALDNINFDVLPGEVHALLGENGAGKSTLMKILSGAYEPTAGTVVIEGVEHDRLTTKQSSEAGISIIYQELSVIEQLSIMETIFVGNLATTKVAGIPVVDHKAMYKRTKELLEQVGLKRDPMTSVRDLSISEKQMVEIARAIAFSAKVIVMDEPTSSLTDEEVNQLFAIIAQLKAEGRSVVYISHKLKEITAMCDRVTVLKDGTAVGTRDVAGVTVDQLVTMMVGRELQGKYNEKHEGHVASTTPILEVKGMTRRDGYVKNAEFTLYEGEILGFSGLVGSGRSELMEVIYGAAPRRDGSVLLHGKPLSIKTPYDAVKAGICMLTEDRRYTGILANFSLRRNFAIGEQIKSSSGGGLIGLIDFARELAIAKEQGVAMQVKMRDIEQNITELSGGNQQKVLLGRQLATDAKVIIFDEPTKGIDVGTKAEFYAIMRRLANEGVGVIVVSSEMPELLAVCDRIIVFAEGKQRAEFPIEEATEENLVRAATHYGNEEENQ